MSDVNKSKRPRRSSSGPKSESSELEPDLRCQETVNQIWWIAVSRIESRTCNETAGTLIRRAIWCWHVMSDFVDKDVPLDLDLDHVVDQQEDFPTIVRTAPLRLTITISECQPPFCNGRRSQSGQKDGQAAATYP
jgi:hypothetical protein